MIGWGLIMTVASYPASGLPLAPWLWPTYQRVNYFTPNSFAAHFLNSPWAWPPFPGKP
jgi:hypothetical protein